MMRNRLFPILMIVALLGSALVRCTPPALLNVTYTYKEVTDIRNTFSFTATIFELTFDQNIYIGNNAITLYNSTNKATTTASTVCFPKYDETCASAPVPIYAQIGTALLVCGSNTFDSSLTTNVGGGSLRIPNGLIPLPSVGRDTFLGFTDIIGWTDTELVSVDPAKVSYLFFNDFVFQSDRINVNGRPGTTDILQCKIELGTSYAGISKAFTNQGGEVVSLATVPANYTLKPNLPLDVQDVAVVSNYLEDTINAIQSPSSVDDLNFKTFQAQLVIESDTYACGMDLVGEYIDSESSTPVSFSTDICGQSINQAGYSSDPCCNSTLLWTECCAVRQISVASPILAQSSGYGSLLGHCKNPSKANETLLNLISTVATSQNPVSGCTSTYLESLKTSQYSDLVAFIDECNTLIFGVGEAGYPCTSNADCVQGTTCNSVVQICDYPRNNDQLNAIIINCHVNKMPPFVKSFLEEAWTTATSPSNFVDLYTSKVIVQNCIGANSSQFTEIKTSSGYEYVIANEAECLAGQYCPFLSTITTQANCIEGDYCVIDYDTQDSITFPQYCYTLQYSQTDCEAVGGVWDPTLLMYNCKLPGITSVDQCINSTICPATEAYPSYNQKRCNQPFCYKVTTGTCPSTDYIKTTSSAKLCVKPSVSADDCVGLYQYTWWQGQGWISGSRQTQTQCAQPLCATGDYLWLDRNVNCASFSYCSHPAALCYNPGEPKCTKSLLATDCQNAGGTLDGASCTFTFPGGDILDKFNDCNAIGGTFTDCSQLTLDTCAACVAGTAGCNSTYSGFGCQIGWKNDPYTQSLCQSYAGICSDYNYFSQWITDREPSCVEQLPSYTISDDCSGVCLTGFLISSQGAAYCDNGYLYSPIGCVNNNITTRASCTSGTWYTLAYNQVTCESNSQYFICNENGVYSNKSKAECNLCSGTYGSPFVWQKGTWGPGQNFSKTLWLENAQWGSVNSWGNSINVAFIQDAIQSAQLTKLGPSTKSELLCTQMPYIYALSSIPCDCGGDPNTPSDCYTSGTTRFIIGVAKVCYGWGDQLVSGPMEIIIYANSIPKSVNCIDLEIFVQPASQFFRTQILSSDVLSNSINSYDQSDVVVNSNNIIVGQIIGDGIEIQMTYNNSGNVMAFTSALAAPMTLCIEPRTDISHHYPVMDFASYDGSTWTPTESTITVDNGKYCASITVAGTYFPILRIENWKEALYQSVFTKAQFAFIYIIAVAFTLAFFGAVYSLVRSIYNTNFKVTLPRLINFEIAIFCLVRSLYLYLTGKQTVSADGNLAAFYLLSELPLYIFLSIFSTLVFFWVELNRNASSRNKSFLSNMRIPFIVANSSMYVMFIIVLSIFHSLNASQQHTLRIIYTTILAFLCVVLIIGYWVFGGRLIVIQFKVLRIKSQKLNRNLKNMTIVLLITSLALTLQILFLFLSAFSDRVTIALALVYYVVVELIPCILLIYVFMKFNRKSKKKSSDLGTSETDEGNSSKAIQMTSTSTNEN